jgi:hypothetical protein
MRRRDIDSYLMVNLLSGHVIFDERESKDVVEIVKAS